MGGIRLSATADRPGRFSLILDGRFSHMLLLVIRFVFIASRLTFLVCDHA